MRAVFLNKEGDYSVGEILSIEGDSFNHLAKVCRVRVGESVKVLMGNAKSLECLVESISKRELTLKIVDQLNHTRAYNIDLLLGLPKRDAFELTLKNSIELGVTKIIPFISEYSQWNIRNFERLGSLIESAIIQSNNPFSFSVENPLANHMATREFIEGYDHAFLTTLATKDNYTSSIESNKNILIIVGPEGGFSKEEEEYFLSFKNVQTLNTKGPIMRTPNAVSTAVGFILGKIAGL